MKKKKGTLQFILTAGPGKQLDKTLRELDINSKKENETQN